MALSPDGKFLATTRGDYVSTRADIIIWNTETSAIEHIIHDTGFTSCLAISSDGSRIAAGKGRLTMSCIPQVIVWDIKTGESTYRLPCRCIDKIGSVSFSPINPAILSMSFEFTTLQIDLNDRNSTPIEFNGSIFKYAPSEDVVATSGYGHNPYTAITICSASTGELVHVKHRAHIVKITDLCWSPDGSKIASSSHMPHHESGGNCKVWDSSTFHLIHSIDTLYAFGNFVSLSWGPNWKRAVDRRLACAMALHDRIGNGSLLKHLHPDLLRIMAWDAEHE
jgi:WD40 repeat protein